MYKTIVVPLDGSKLAECVLSHVENLAKGCQVENISLVRVVEPLSPMVMGEYGGLSAKQIERIESELTSEAETYLQQRAQELKFNGVKTEWKVLSGMTAEAIAQHAVQAGADLIVISTHGRSGVSRWVWGNVADRVLRSSCVPVLMVRAPGCFPGV